MTTTAVAAITNTASKNNWHNARRECSTENGKVNDTIYNAYARTHILLAFFFLSLFYIEHSHQFLVWILLAKWEILYSQSADVDECICICASMCICAIKPKLAVCSCVCVCSAFPNKSMENVYRSLSFLSNAFYMIPHINMHSLCSPAFRMQLLIYFE